MILISINLSSITSIYRRYTYIRLIIAKYFLQCCFFNGGGGGEMSHHTKYQERKFSYIVESPKRPPHEEK